MTPNHHTDTTTAATATAAATALSPRCPVYVKDICRVISHFAQQLPKVPEHTTYNLGGPDRMSRVDMAVAVAEHKGYPQESILSMPSAEVQRWAEFLGSRAWGGGRAGQAAVAVDVIYRFMLVRGPQHAVGGLLT